MPSIKKRVKGNKGQKWKKGQSCVSNPENNRHREAVKERFFQKLEGESGLTKKALEAHDANLRDVSNQLDTLHVEPEDYQSVGKTFNTFATNFTSCTIPAFENFFKNFSASSELHTKMLAIHATAQEYMQENSIAETPSSYLCALMVSLEGLKANEEDVTATLSLMSKVIRKVPEDILKMRFLEFSRLLNEILTTYQDAKPTLIINVIGCLSILLRCQNSVQWTHPSALQMLKKVLAYSVHENPKIRRCAQYNVSAIVQGSNSSSSKEDYGSMEVESDITASSIHPGATSVGEFISSNLQTSCETMNAKSTLHLLVFLQQIIHCLPKNTLRNVCEVVLGVMHIGDSLVNLCALKALRSLVKADRLSPGLSVEINVSLINALTCSPEGRGTQQLRLTPSMLDEKLSSIWISTVTAMLVNLVKLAEGQGIKHIGIFSLQLIFYFKSDFPSIHEEVFHSFEHLLDGCLAPLGGKMKTYASEIQSMFEAIEKGLSLQYQPAWAYVFRSLSACFRVIGPQLPHIMGSCLKNLSELADNPDIPNRGVLELAIGSALNGIGPGDVLRVVPLQITGNIIEDQRHFWILPVFQRYIKNSRVAFFVTHFFPLAEKCSLLLEKLEENDKGDTLLAKTYKTIEHQIWALLPSFANGAVDAGQAISMEIVDLKKLAKLNANQQPKPNPPPKKIFGQELCHHIRSKEDTRLYAMSALRNMVIASKENPGKLADYSKNYLPALFSLYMCRPYNCRVKVLRDKPDENSEAETTIDPGQRLSAYSTIQIYLSITPETRLMDLFRRAFNRCDDESDFFKRQACFNLLRTFIPYLKLDSLDKVFSKICPLITNHDESFLQKSAYRFLEDLLCVESENGKAFVNSKREEIGDVLLSSLSVTAPNVLAPRLRCLGHYLKCLPEGIEMNAMTSILQKVVSESVLCCGETSSAATRKAAFSLLASLEGTLQRLLKLSKEEALTRCLEMMLAGLSDLNESPMLVSNSILAITASLYHYREFMSKEILDFLVKNISLLMASSDRKVVKACLNFFRVVFVAFPIDMTSEHVETLVKSVINMNEDCLRKFRLKTRDLFASLIRKFGSQRIMAFIPEDEVILRKRVKNIHKAEARKKKIAKENHEDSESSDEDEDKKAPSSLEEILAKIDADIEMEEMGSKNPIEDKKEKPKKKKGRKDVWIKEDEDQIIDLLDPKSAEAFTTRLPSERRLQPSSSQKDDNYGFKVDSASGKYIITVENEEKPKTRDADFENLDDLKNFLDLKEGAQQGKIKKRKRTVSENSSSSAQPPIKAPTGKSKLRGEGNKFDYGAEFRSKKSGGDITKKGGVAPFAYVQLTKEKLNKRKKAKFAGQFKSLVRGARKGAIAGSKLKKRKR